MVAVIGASQFHCVCNVASQIARFQKEEQDERG